MNTIENTEAPEPITATPIKRVLHRKPRVNRDGTLNALTRLKELAHTSPTLRDTLYDLTETMTCEQWIQCVNEVLEIGLGGHRSAVTRFRKYVETLYAMEDQESRRELIIQRYREQFPNETQEELNQRAVLFFMQEAFAIGDRDGFIRIGRYGVTLRAQATKDRMQAVNERMANLKIRVLELRLAQLETPPTNPHRPEPIPEDHTKSQYEEIAAEVPVPPIPVGQSCRSAVTETPPVVVTIEQTPVPDPPPLLQASRPFPPPYPLFPLFPTFPQRSLVEKNRTLESDCAELEVHP